MKWRGVGGGRSDSQWISPCDDMTDRGPAVAQHRVGPEEVVINIDRTSPVPVCPLKGHNWGEVVSRRDATWIVSWKETVQNHWKYVHFNSSSYLKGISDRDKYEVARKLKGCIGRIRKSVREDMKSDSIVDR